MGRVADNIAMLTRVGISQMRHMSVTKASMPEDIQTQAVDMLRKYQHPLEELVAEIDSVVDHEVSAAALTDLALSVEALKELKGWRDKSAFWM